MCGDGPLTILAPAVPGGGWDQTARAMQHAFAVIEPGVSVQVENVPGAAGTIGLARFVNAERGNPGALLITGLVMVSAITANRAPVSLHQTTPIARLTGEYEVIVVPAASPLTTLNDLLGVFRASPSAVTWGGGSAGGTDDLLIRLMAEAVGVPPRGVNYIAFPGGGAALAALLGGQLTAGVSGYGEFASQIEAGTLRALAISAPSRVAGINAPTLREEGVDLDLANWRGVVAPPGLTDAERDALTSRVQRLAASEGWRTLLARHGWEDMLLTGPAFGQFLSAEQDRVNAALERLHADAPPGRPSGWLALTPMTAPSVAIVGLGLLATCVLVEYRKNRPKGRAGQLHAALENTEPVDASAPIALRESRAYLLTGVLCAHAVAFPLIGFVAASTALFAIAAALFGSRRWGRDAALGFAMATLLYVVFTTGLGLTLPADPLTRWLRE